MRGAEDEAAIRAVIEATGRRPPSQVMTALAGAAVRPARELVAVWRTVTGRARRPWQRKRHCCSLGWTELEGSADTCALHVRVTGDTWGRAVRALEREGEARMRIHAD